MGRVVAFPNPQGGYEAVTLERVSPARPLLSQFVFIACAFSAGFMFGTIMEALFK